MAAGRAIICCLSAASFWPAILFVLPGIVLALARRAEPGDPFSAGLGGKLVAGGGAGAHQAAALCDRRPIRRWRSWRRCSCWTRRPVALSDAGALDRDCAICDRRVPVHRRGHSGAALFRAARRMAGRLLAAAGVGASPGAGRAGAGDPAQVPAGGACWALPRLLVFAPALTAVCRPAAGPALDQRAPEADGGRCQRARRCRRRPWPAMRSPAWSLPWARMWCWPTARARRKPAPVIRRPGAGGRRAQGDFLARLAELQADATPVGEMSGINYSRGRKVHVTCTGSPSCGN